MISSSAPHSWPPLLTIITTFLTLLLILHPTPTTCDADFLDVRTSLEKDRSGKRGDVKGKYFHESVFDPHYDGRFAQDTMATDARLSHLTTLMQTFLATMSDIGAETWIMHGTLLGWFWNQRIMPWDTDIDVQVSEPTIAFLAKYYNMTEYRYTLPGIKGGRTYLLEVNPSFIYRDQADTLNVIDARWIDTTTGLFIDISTVRPDLTRRAQGIPDALMCKDRHHYLERDIFPLRDSFFQGIPVKIPYEYAALLAEEYGAGCLTNSVFKGYEFNGTSQMWVFTGKGLEEKKKNGRPAVRPYRRPMNNWEVAGGRDQKKEREEKEEKEKKKEEEEKKVEERKEEKGGKSGYKT